MNAETSSLAGALGISRGVILHVDDLGMSHSANEAFLRLHGRQLVRSGSIMVPCPWFREIAEAAAADQTTDVGVHFTLTSEWEHYRWAPISTSSRAAPDPRAYAEAVAGLESQQLLLPDEFRGTLAVPADQTQVAYRRMIAGLPRGVTHIALHSSVPGDVEAISPHHAAWRTREYALLNQGAIHDWCAEEQIDAIGYGPIWQLWFASSEG